MMKNKLTISENVQTKIHELIIQIMSDEFKIAKDNICKRLLDNTKGPTKKLYSKIKQELGNTITSINY